MAVTHVDQVFYNPNDQQMEGEYLFPLPTEAVVNQFILWVDGKAVEGKILTAEQARKIYEDTTRKLLDPALLEYVGRGAVQARIFPIPAKGERRIELEYSQALTASENLVRYVYPLNTEKFSKSPLESVSVSVEIASKDPIRAVYSPSHNVAVTREDDNHASASYEAKNETPDKDFALYYSVGSTQALHLLTFRDPSVLTEKDGYFLLLLAPGMENTKTTQAKDVFLVLDRSGSMEGEKFLQAQAALKYILGHLNAEDRFYLLSFSTDIKTYASELRPVSEANQAIQWSESLSAAGSTDINRALLEAAAAADKERPTYLIFMTDGLPTKGVVNSEEIIANFAKAAPTDLRFMAFGVGYDVDTFLLDSLATAHHGQTTYVKPGEKLDEVLSGFYEKMATPVMTDLSINFKNVKVYDLYPQPLPDLFKGSQIVVAGRYKEGGKTPITLSGKINGEKVDKLYENQNFENDNRLESGLANSLPRLWATRKIGYLLNEIRLKGPDKETVDQIVKLSIRFGIVTPYTSYLVTEPAALGAEGQNNVADQTYKQMLQDSAAPSYGQQAFEKAAGQGAMQRAESVPAAPSEMTQSVKTIGQYTFVYKEGKWIDTRFDPQNTKPQTLTFLSENYFQLIDTNKELAGIMALGSQVIFILDGKAYEIIVGQLPEAVTPVPQTNPPATQGPGEMVKNTQQVKSPTPMVAQPMYPDQAGGMPISIYWLAGSALFVVAGYLIFRLRKR
jgi:Ca-activated chloride channel family protein